MRLSPKPPRTSHLSLFLFATVNIGIASASQITLNFDSSNANPCIDGTAYLAAAGITITGQASARICATGATGAAVAVSGQNLLLLNNPPPSNSTYEYFFNFSSPVSDVSFFRTEILSPSTGPAWTAEALAADGSIISTTGEGTTFAPSAQLFSLPGSDIVRIEFNSNNSLASTYNTPPIDDLSFTSTAASTPEPVSIVLVGASLVILLALTVRRRTL